MVAESFVGNFEREFVEIVVPTGEERRVSFICECNSSRVGQRNMAVGLDFPGESPVGGRNGRSSSLDRTEVSIGDAKRVGSRGFSFCRLKTGDEGEYLSGI
ncbi:hypothetical protein C485_13425 [Natrinema altunense JCM 12890]|uniref:Uncharacterized protein n=1 Tax=Natrinema altunense (strain JCM 12890 / CGMCC 1.3731 / AJ2) TaxID=1227494 RepID=L9ZHB6_NATA2|nr:hypothetical protein C485_13425 [Natrinema altunense JCM 12890]